jgi:hypothetical protein
MNEPRPFGLADVRGCALTTIYVAAAVVAAVFLFYAATHLGDLQAALDRIVSGAGR